MLVSLRVERMTIGGLVVLAGILPKVGIGVKTAGYNVSEAQPIMKPLRRLPERHA